MGCAAARTDRVREGRPCGESGRLVQRPPGSQAGAASPPRFEDQGDEGPRDRIRSVARGSRFDPWICRFVARVDVDPGLETVAVPPLLVQTARGDCRAARDRALGDQRSQWRCAAERRGEGLRNPGHGRRRRPGPERRGAGRRTARLEPGALESLIRRLAEAPAYLHWLRVGQGERVELRAATCAAAIA